MTPEVDDLKFDVERLETAVDVLAASVNAATIRAETAEGEAERLRAHLHLAGTVRKSEAILRKRAEAAIERVRALCGDARAVWDEEPDAWRAGGVPEPIVAVVDVLSAIDLEAP